MNRFRAGFASALDAYYDVTDPEVGLKRKQMRRAGEYLAKFHQVRMQSIEFKDDYRDGGLGGGSGYESAQRGRLDATWLYGNQHPDSALEEGLLEMREKSNSAYKNHELFAGHVIRRVQRVAGTGITISPQIRTVAGKITQDQADLWNPLLRDIFERWSVKAGGPQLPFYMIQRQVVRHIEKDGTAFVQFGDVEQNDPRIPINLRLKVIHPRRVETPPEFAMDPDVRHGIRSNSDNDVLGYYVRTTHPDDIKSFSIEWEFVPAFYDNGLPRMVQICDLDEAEQHIGYPHGQVGLRRFKNIDEYGTAEMERNIVASCMAGFAVGGTADPSDLAAAASSGMDANGRLIQDVAPASFNYVPNADSIQFSNPQGPQGTYEGFVDHEARLAACGLGTSKEMMTGDWRGLTYSGGKLIWVDEQGPIDCSQLDLITLLLLPTWQHIVNRCATTGLIDVSAASFRREPHIYERCKFIPQKRPSIDPQRERASAIADIAAGITPHSDDVEQMNGRPAEEVYDDIERNIQQLEKLGITLADLRPKGGTPLGGTNPTAATGGDGRKKREAAGAT